MTSTRLAALLALALSTLPACSGGSGGEARPPKDPPATSTALSGTQLSPGVEVRVLGVSGGSNSNGSFRVGDVIELRFRLEKTDGSPWGLSEMGFSSVLVSGPAFSYQRVIAERNDVVQRAKKNPDGSYTYRFQTPIPAQYLPPYNDSPTFDGLYGELTGQPLLDGTYTVGLGFAWSYTVDGNPFVDSGESTFDFALGGGTVVDHREVTTQAHCNQCHTSFRAHEGLRVELTMCVLCHTAGAEDLNDPNIAGGTPGVNIDSKVLFHKLHSGKHLPSVVGIRVKPNGKLNYTAPSIPYQVVGDDGTVYDYSSVDFPVFPGRAMPTLRDFGYKGLNATNQAKEDLVRTGITSCAVCHGHPEDVGGGGGHHHATALTTPEDPEDGTLVYVQPSINACGSCHDDWIPTQQYEVNLQSMPVQPDNSGCTECHPFDGGPLAVHSGHLHPLEDSTQQAGLHTSLYEVLESGVNDGDGTVDIGESIELNFEVHDDSGGLVIPGQLDELRVIVSGPTTNPHVVLDTTIPPSALGSAPYVLNLPEVVPLEHVGNSTANSGEVFGLARSPNLAVAGTAASVHVRSGTVGGATALGTPASAPQAFVDVIDVTGFARGDYVVIDDGLAGLEEYLEVQLVEGNRLWFRPRSTVTAGQTLRTDHALGASVLEVQLDAKVPGLDYLMDPQTGTITELIEFGAGNAVLATYTGDFEMPATYPGGYNDSPDLGEAAGDWGGKPLVEGTYTLTFVSRQRLLISFFAESTDYELVAPAATLDFLVGNASQYVAYEGISSPENCNACHVDVWYHENRFRGFATCIACHASGGSEDLSRAVAGNAPATPGRSVAFRELLHVLHRGAELYAPSAQQFVGSGEAAYPDNYEVHTYETHQFPAQPGGTQNCVACHGIDNQAWLAPADREHPLGQLQPVPEWRSACAGCHDDPSAIAHIDSNTAPSGQEACAICHGPGQVNAVDLEHMTR